MTRLDKPASSMVSVAVSSHPMDAHALTDALGGKWYGSYGKACCPSHEDRHPSLSISDGDDGKLLVHCHAECAQDAVVDGLRQRGLWPESVAPVLMLPTKNGQAPPAKTVPAPVTPITKGPRRIIATYDYHDAFGALLFQTVRYEPKDFGQRRPNGYGGWIGNLDGVQRVLYRLPELLEADQDRTVFVVEGEKDADLLWSLGLVATTSPIGAGKWREDYAVYLANRNVVLIPDNDKPGREHMETVANGLAEQAASVLTITLPGLTEKQDISDWLDVGHTVEDLVDLVARVRAGEKPEPRYPIQTLSELLSCAEQTHEQLVQGILWAHRVTWAFARPGSGKTFFLLALALHIAAGRDVDGRPVKQTPVLIISEDSPFSVIADYIDTLCADYGFDPDTLPLWVNKIQGLRVTEREGVDVILETIAACPQPPGMVLMDACEALVPSKAFTRHELQWMEILNKELLNRRITPIVIDHTRRPPNQKDQIVKNDPLEDLYGGVAKQAISDVMMHFKGDPRSGIHITYCKFRGPVPEPLDVTYRQDEGWVFKAQPVKTMTENQRRILAFMQRQPSTWYSSTEVAEGAQIGTARTAQRALGELAEMNWLEREGEKRGAHYRCLQDGGRLFDR